MRLPTLAAGMIIGCLALILTSPAIADDSAATTAARQVIASQIEAFGRDDGAAAYAHAAPEVQLKFPTPEIFMRMVKLGYAPVYRPRSFDFTETIEGNGTIQQNVDLTAADGEYWVAEYTLRQMPDGSLKISGCRLTKRQGIGT